jgi:hypothetical protein
MQAERLIIPYLQLYILSAFKNNIHSHWSSGSHTLKIKIKMWKNSNFVGLKLYKNERIILITENPSVFYYHH